MKNSVKNLLEGQLCQIFYNSVLFNVYVIVYMLHTQHTASYFSTKYSSHYAEPCLIVHMYTTSMYEYAAHGILYFFLSNSPLLSFLASLIPAVFCRLRWFGSSV